MTFLAPLLLWFSGLAAIPLVLHLVRRRRVQEVFLPTFRFLAAAATRHRLRYRWQDPLVMVLRMLILILTILTFAGLVWPRPRTTGKLPAIAPETLLVVDDSYSTQARSGTDSTVGEKLAMIAKQISERVPSHLRVLAGSELRDRTDTADLPHYQLGELVSRARDLSGPSGRVWVLAEGTHQDWFRFGQPVAATSAWNQPEILFPDPAEDGSNRANWGITEILVLGAPLFEDEEVHMEVSVFGGPGDEQSLTPPSLVVNWSKADTGTVRTLERSLAGGTEQVEGTFSFNLGPINPGSTVKTSLEWSGGESDDLTVDNQMEITPVLWKRPMVGLICEDPITYDLLEVALSEFEFLGTSGAQTVAEAELLVIAFTGEPLPAESMRILSKRLAAGVPAVVLHSQATSRTEVEDLLGVSLRPELENNGGQAFGIGQNGPDWLGAQIAALPLEPAGWKPDQVLQDGRAMLWWTTDRGPGSPLVQRLFSGSGSVLVQNVPLDGREPPLVFEPLWVPWLELLIKGAWSTAQPPVPVRSLHVERGSESDLRVLTASDREMLSASGLRLHQAETVLSGLADAPRTHWEATPVLLVVLTLLAICELWLSNRIRD